jgi:hypothetical protein
VHPRLHHDAQEAQLGAAQDRARAFAVKSIQFKTNMFFVSHNPANARALAQELILKRADKQIKTTF